MLHKIDTDRSVLRQLIEITALTDTVYRLQGFAGGGPGPYPPGMPRDAFLEAAATDPELARPDTVIRRGAHGTFHGEHYTVAYAEPLGRIAEILDAAARQSSDPAFRRYLESASACMHSTSPDAYRTMMRHWLAARHHPVQLVLVWDETYSDTQFGLKGSVDAAVFRVDETLTPVVQWPLDTWPMLLDTLQFPAGAVSYSGFFTRVYTTEALGGALPEMKLRAWNLPDDPQIRLDMGAHQLILKENTLGTLDGELLPMIRDRFHLNTADLTDRNLFLQGLLWTLTAHELGHNAACYDAQSQLLEFNDTFEELKANILPLLWVMNEHAHSRMDDAEAEAATAVYLALDLMDCVLAETVPGRISYARATRIQMNRLESLGALTMDDGRIHIRLAEMDRANRTLLDEILGIMASGAHAAAERYLDAYGKPLW